LCNGVIRWDAVGLEITLPRKEIRSRRGKRCGREFVGASKSVSNRWVELFGTAAMSPCQETLAELVRRLEVRDIDREYTLTVSTPD